MEDDVRNQSQLRHLRSKLGAFHDIDGKSVFVADITEAIPALKDVMILLDRTERTVRNTLGEWNVAERNLVPMFLAYREDSKELVLLVLQILARLTQPIDKVKMQDACADDQVAFDVDLSVMLKYLQDCKESCSKAEFFRVLVSEWMAVIPEEISEMTLLEATPNSQLRYTVLMLMRNLVNIPDPVAGDPGYKANRQSLQVIYVRSFKQEAIFDVLTILAEKIGASTERADVQQDEETLTLAWLLHSIIVKVCTVVSPSALAKLNLPNDKKEGTLLENLVKSERLFRMPTSSRHGAFGMSYQSRVFLKDPSLKYEEKQDCKARNPVEKRFKNREQKGKEDLTRDKLFLDLQAGSVMQHNAQNSFMKSNVNIVEALDNATLKDVKQFYDDCISLNAVNNIVEHMMREIKKNAAPIEMGQERDARFSGYAKFDLLNFTSWFLEYFRLEFLVKQKEKPDAVLDIGTCRELINLDTIAFVADVVTSEGKTEKINASKLVIGLRCAVHQMKMIQLVSESPDAEMQTIGEVMIEDLIKRIPYELCWIIKNFKSTTHDPRALTYLVEGIHYCFRLMEGLQKGDKEPIKFTVQITIRGRTVLMQVSDFVNELSEGRIIDHLFMLLESSKSSGAHLAYVCRLIGRIIHLRPTNVCIFFQISFFARMEKIIKSQRVQNDKKKYRDVLQLLQYIMSRFFELAKKNSFLGIELLYPKLKERKSNLISNEDEWKGIMENYNTLFFERKFEDFKNGATYKKMLEDFRGGKTFAVPWTMEEDQVLKDNFATVKDAADFLGRLTALLPEINGHERREEEVHNRLIELGFLRPKKKPMTLQEAMAKYILVQGADAREALDTLASKLALLLPKVPVEVVDTTDDAMFKKVLHCLKARKVRDQQAWRLGDPALELRDTFNRIRLLEDAELREFIPKTEEEFDDLEPPHESYVDDEELDIEALRRAAGLPPRGETQDFLNEQRPADTEMNEEDQLLDELFGDVNPGEEDIPAAFSEAARVKAAKPQSQRKRKVKGDTENVDQPQNPKRVKHEVPATQENVQYQVPATEQNVKHELPATQQDVQRKVRATEQGVKHESAATQEDVPMRDPAVDATDGRRTQEGAPNAEYTPDELEMKLEEFLNEYEPELEDELEDEQADFPPETTQAGSEPYVPDTLEQQLEDFMNGASDCESNITDEERAADALERRLGQSSRKSNTSTDFKINATPKPTHVPDTLEQQLEDFMDGTCATPESADEPEYKSAHDIDGRDGSVNTEGKTDEVDDVNVRNARVGTSENVDVPDTLERKIEAFIDGIEATPEPSYIPDTLERNIEDFMDERSAAPEASYIPDTLERKIEHFIDGVDASPEPSYMPDTLERKIEDFMDGTSASPELSHIPDTLEVKIEEFLDDMDASPKTSHIPDSLEQKVP